MNCLFLDIASHSGLIAISSDSAVIAATEVDHKISDADLISLVEDLLKAAELTYKSLTHIACVIGPGGFTSLRIAVAYANILADQLQIPAAGVHLSDLYTARASDNVYWLHSTKKHELFVKGGEFSEPTLVNIEDLSAKIPDGALWMGELIPEHQAALSTLKAADLVETVPILPGVVSGLSYQKELLTPWYGRGW